MQAHKQFFLSGKTYSIAWRLKQLQQLKQAIQKNKATILSALHTDLNKPEFEAFSGEILPILKEIDYFLKHLVCLAKPKKKPTPLLMWPSQSSVTPTPFGTVLIMAPWNFPIQLTLIPLIGAIAAGNCVVIKPSEHAPQSAAALAKIVEESFNREYVSVVQGDAETAQALLEEPFDYIFFTGSTRVGKIVMHKAADQLIPVTLELGGKNPCIVDSSCDINVAAKRIAWGKFYNAGQNCVASDYVLIDARIKEVFIKKTIEYLVQFYGATPQNSPDYARIINQKHVHRLKEMLETSTVIHGGQIDETTRFIAPTIVDNVTLESAVLEEEIFGPILPIITYTYLEEALTVLSKFPKPLAIYLFNKSKKVQATISNGTQSGAVCINDVAIQALSNQLPFGGVGTSGIGRYHGKYSFNTFSYERAVLRNLSWPDIPIRYAPYTKLKTWLLKLFV